MSVPLTRLGSFNKHGFPTFEIDLNGIEMDEDIELHVRQVLTEIGRLGHKYTNLYIKRIATGSYSPEVYSEHLG